MAENNFFLNNNFGININLPQKTINTVKRAVKQEVEENLGINEVKNFFEDNDKVFSGEVAKEIRKYQAMIYSLGQISREGQPKVTFRRTV